MNFRSKYIVRKSGLGDVLWIEPVISEVSKKYKKITVFTKYNTLFENFPANNVVFKNNLNILEKIILKIESFFSISIWFINLDGSYENNPQCHFLEAYFKKANINSTLRYPRLFLTNDEIVKNSFYDDYVILHLESFSGKNYRSVYGIDWEKVVKHINEMGLLVLQINKNDSIIKGSISIKTDLREMISLIYNSKLFIGIDSGPSHIAATLNIPSLIFFGAVNPWFRHLKRDFIGKIMQSYCQFSNCYHTSKKGKEIDCKLVGNAGIPACSLHNTDSVLKEIENLLIK